MGAKLDQPQKSLGDGIPLDGSWDTPGGDGTPLMGDGTPLWEMEDGSLQMECIDCEYWLYV